MIKGQGRNWSEAVFIEKALVAIFQKRTWVKSGLQCGQTVILEHVKKRLLRRGELRRGCRESDRASPSNQRRRRSPSAALKQDSKMGMIDTYGLTGVVETEEENLGVLVCQTCLRRRVKVAQVSADGS